MSRPTGINPAEFEGWPVISYTLLFNVLAKALNNCFP